MFAIISGALAPSIALLSYIYLRDKYESEPLKLIIRLFILGAILVFPAYVFERMFQEGLPERVLFTNVVIIGIIEEFLKWFIIYFIIYKHTEFNEPYDGIVYTVAVAMGFATVENLGYLLFNDLGPTEILLRALLPVSGHAIFGIIMGYFFGIAKFHSKKEFQFLILALFVPITLHSIYNFILYQNYTKWVYLMVPFLAILWIHGLRKIRLAHSLSPFK